MRPILLKTRLFQQPSAAIAVGYESQTQFNREYKRLFGLPPARDVAEAQALMRQSGG